ncbi:hypothetical protein V6N12_018817 [Hibiscus sabdariffa]|uniref:DUF4283 domain-containing protein n=1 Tax=Hibiscus sabdariffa TaxID=183260 RepID=A0ABR2AUA5_9ROSI
MRATSVNEAHVMCIMRNMVLFIFYSAEARDRFLIFGVLNTWFERVENWKASCGMEYRRVWLLISGVPIHAWTNETFECIVAIWGRSEKGESLVNSEVSDVGINPERGVEEGECPAVPVNLVASQATGVGEKEQVMWQELPYLDGLNGHMDLGTVGPVMPPKGSTTESRGHGRPHKGGEAQVGRVSSASFSDIADISIMDSDVNYRQSAILQEAKATVSLGARLGGFLAFATLSCVTKPLEVRRHVKAAFEAHFSQPQVTNTFEPILLHGSLSGEYRDRLEQPFTFRGVEYGSK